MQFPESWLRTMVAPALTTGELADLLTMSGLEVERCEPVAPPFSGVVVGEVQAVAKHPNADRLTLCQVDVGTSALLRVVCGAPNVKAGMKTACALVGAKLPGPSTEAPLVVRATAVRGVDSQGMLCSARELGLSEDHSGVLALASDAPVGMSLREWLQLDDHVFLIKLTPNRADCLSVLGIAREVAALTRSALHAPHIEPVPARCDAAHPVRISAPDGCGRFTGRVIRGVDARAATPEWMRQRLERAGQRSISALVDVTNYVMLELGRPLHVYDVAKLRGSIDVRFGRKGERVKLLNEQVIELEDDVLAITDDSGPIGLAGIMGGDSTKADLDTREVFLEAAFFYPAAIAGRARRFNFASDASHRFERGVDFDNNVQGIERATGLILEICGGEPGPVTDTVACLPERKPVRMRAARAQRVIGVPVPVSEMAETFVRLGLPATQLGSGTQTTFVVQPPSYRFDLEIEEDLIEEIARLYGFERIPAEAPRAVATAYGRPESQRSLHTLRGQLAAHGYQEAINFTFVEPEWESDFAGNAVPIRLLNPIASQWSVMRSTLMGGLVANVRYNLNRKASRVRVFEVGRAFLRDSAAGDGPVDVAGIRQPMRIAAAAFGPALPEQWGAPPRTVDFYDVKGDLEALLVPLSARFEAALHPALHPGRSARVMVAERPAGWVGELHPRWQQKYEIPGPVLLFELDASALETVPVPAYSPVPRFPPVIRDISVVVPEEIQVQGLLEDLITHRPAHVEAISLFDYYRGPGIQTGKKSLAFRVLLQDTQKTMTESEVDAAMQQIRQRLQERFGGEFRQ